MAERIQRGCLLVLALLYATLAVAAEPMPQLVPLDGPPVQAELVSIDTQSAKFIDQTNQQRTLRLGNFVRWGSLMSPTAPDQVLLADGSLLIGRVAAISVEDVLVETGVWGDLTLPRKLVLAVIWQLPTGELRQWRMRDQLVASTGEQDRLLLANGDELLGRLLDGGDGEIRFQAVAGEVTVATELVAGWRSNVMAHTVFPQPPSVIGLRDGTRLSTSDIQLDDRLQVKLAAGVTLGSLPEVRPVPERLIVYFRPANGSVRYLSDVRPLGYKYIPLVGEHVQWEWQADRNVLGGPLSAGDRIYDKGLGMHGTSRLAFELDPSDEEFQAEICLDRSAGNRGSVVFHVFVTTDGSNWKPAFKSDVVRGGDDPFPVRVDIRSAKRLALVVDYADGGDVLDRANWIGARLVKHVIAGG